MHQPNPLADALRAINDVSTIASALAQVFEGAGPDDEYSTDSDLFRCYSSAADLLNAAYNIVDKEWAVFSAANEASSLQLSICHARDYLRLLSTKAGHNDFCRASASSLAESLLGQLRDEVLFLRSHLTAKAV